MNDIKIITLFQHNQNIPFMTCMVKNIEENGQGMKLTLVNGNNIYVKDYGSFFLSESVDDCDKERIANVYRRLISELSQISEETVMSLIPSSVIGYDGIRNNNHKQVCITNDDEDVFNEIKVRNFEVADSGLGNRSFNFLCKN